VTAAGRPPGPAAGEPRDAPAIRARDLLVRYAGRRVVEIESLQVPQGKTLVLLGPNGSGKSTLLRVLALLERPARGELTLLGEAVAPDERQRLRLRRRMATVFQDPLLTDQSVFDNVAMGLRFRGLSGRALAGRVESWLSRFGIAHLAGRRARTLSGGEAQRTSLARAFVLEPEILFLDEPFGSLDLAGREALALELEAILRESRIATVLVTHDRGEAQMLGDRVAVLLEGRIAQEDVVRTVFHRPATAPVAAFLGVENMISVAVRDPHTVDLMGIPVPVELPANAGQRALLCLRAEDVHISPAGTVPDPGAVGLPARVRHVVPYGVPYRVHLDAGLPLVALAAQLTLERLGVEPGIELLAWFDPRAVHVVPEHSGKA
jgi:tungstate transport system ATP-binding protein